MFLKIFLFLFVLVRLVLIRSEDEYSCIPLLRTVRNEMFARMASYTQISWNHTESRYQNFHIFPILMKLRHYFVKIKLYYEYTRGSTVTQDNPFLQKCYSLAKAMVLMQNTSDVKLEIPSAIFYDIRYISSKYADDLQINYRTEVYEMPLDPENEQSLLSRTNEWASNKTLGRQPRRESFQLRSKSYAFSLLIFASCWDITPNRTRYIETRSPRPKRFIPPGVPKLPRLNFELLEEQIEVESFSLKDQIAYYNDTQHLYEAIRIPFNNEKFAMIVMLPYHGHSLEIFGKLTAEDYQLLLQRIHERYEYIHYTIPIINSSQILINDQGASINGDKLCDYIASRNVPYDKNMIDYMPFFVNRPFGIIIYHEKTSFILMYALVRNPSSGLWPIPKFQIRVNMDGDEEDLQYNP